MARFSLINPNDAACYTFSRARTRRIPLGQAYIAAALKRAGHSVWVLDASADDLSQDEIVKKIADSQPEFVGISGTTPLYSQITSLSKKIKDAIPNVTVILGGPHVSALPIPSLNTSAADFICIGEGEESVVSIVDTVINRTDPSKIPGIAYKSNGDGVVTQKHRLRLNQPIQTTIRAVDLNVCPIPARDIYDHSKYVDYARGIVSSQTGAMFSRGCPGKCAFCGAANTLVRWRNLDNVIAELKQIQDMGISNLFVMDDTYTNQKKRVLDLSKRIVESGIKLNISVQLRLDQIDKEVCDAMYASGVKYVGPGIESGSEKIMKAIGKGPRESKEHMREKIRLLKEYDWIIRCSYVFGMVGETEKDIMETIEFAKELDANESAFSILTPYPDSPLWNLALKMGKVDEYMDFNRFLYYHTVGCNLSEVPTDRLLELHELAYNTVKSTAYTLHTLRPN
ncbi:MAG: B12-binding domain-containing radical SAM protein [Nitrospirae bacterium]|nr:B12-binding domain-containing radical SAM protein [Nitrospirota bacterium]